jgi:hypothetical protein
MSNLETSPTSEERFSDLIEETQDAFVTKLEKNIRSGLENFQNGTWEPFSGFSFEKTQKLELAQLVLSEESKKEVLDRIVCPLKELTTKYGISAVYTGLEDQDSHISLDIAKVEFSDPTIRQQVLTDLHSPENRLRTLGEAVVNSNLKLTG